MALRRHIKTYVATGGGTDNWHADIVGDALVRCLGAGGGGTTNVAGGGGGAYADEIISAPTPGASYSYAVGTSAANTNGGDTTFDSTVVVAKGGLSGANGGTGGTAAASTGARKWGGGNGHVAAAQNCGPGSAAGTTAAGGNGFQNGLTAAGGVVQAFGGLGIFSLGGHTGSGGGAQAAAQHAGGRGELRVECDITVDETYPRFQRHLTSRAAAATSHTVTLPNATVSGIAETAVDLTGKRVTVVIAADGAPTITCDDGTYVKIGQTSSTADCTLAVFTKYHSSNPGTTLGFTLSSSQAIKYTVFVDEAADEPEATFSTGTGANPNPTGHTRGASAACLWRTVFCSDDTTTVVANISAPPSGYGDWLAYSARASSDQSLAWAHKYATASSDDPGAWTSTDTDEWAAVTLSYALAANVLSGQDFSAAQGSVEAEHEVSLSGQDFSAAQGDLELQVPLDGQDFLLGQGTLGDGSVQLALEGLDFSAAQGRVTPLILLGQDFGFTQGLVEIVTGQTLLDDAVEAICDHEYVARALLKLAPPMWGKPRLAAILIALMDEVQELECAVNSVLIGRYLDLAFGHTLNRLGKLVGRPNQGWGEAVYKKFIRAQIVVNNSKGGINRVLRIIKALWPDAERRVWWLGGANVGAEVVGTATTEHALETELPGQVVSAGVRLDLWMLPEGPGLRLDHVGGAISGAGVLGHVGDAGVGEPIWHAVRTN